MSETASQKINDRPDSSRRYAFSMILWLMAMLLFAQGTPVHAAQCNPESGCDGCTSKAERMECKFAALVAEGDKMVDQLQQSPDITETQRAGLEKAKDRLTREKGRVKADDFHIMAKKQGTNCQLVENTGNDDGVCDYKNGETCVEVIGDGIGDDDGICTPMKGKNREVCAQICDEEAILQEESNVDESLAAVIESTYDGMTSHLEELNETSPVTARSVNARTLTAAATDPCSMNPQPDRTSYEDYKKARWAVMGSRSGADVMERFCDQTFTSLFLTWTLGAACVAAETAVTAVNTWWSIYDVEESLLDSEVLDATLACAEKAMIESGKTSDQIQVVKNRVAAVKANQAILLELLSTPPGKRPDYPLK